VGVRAISQGLVVAALLLIALGGYARWHAAKLDVLAAQLGEQSREAAASFASTLDGARQEAELRLMGEKRRAALDAAWWGHIGLFAFGAAVLALVAAWVAHEVRTFSELAEDLPDPRHKGDDRGGPPR
jgi:hypothetical protein